MRDVLTVLALAISLSGIAVSLAREEVRCYMGLQSNECQATQPKFPQLPKIPSLSQEDTQPAATEPPSIQPQEEPSNPSPDASGVPNPQSEPENAASMSEDTPSETPVSATEGNETLKSQPLPVEPFSATNENSEPNVISLPSQAETGSVSLPVEPFSDSASSN